MWARRGASPTTPGTEQTPTTAVTVTGCTSRVAPAVSAPLADPAPPGCSAAVRTVPTEACSCVAFTTNLS